MPKENGSEKDPLLGLDDLLNIVKECSGKVRIRVKEKTAVSFDFMGDTLVVDIVDPSILGITKQTNSDTGLFEKLKTAKAVGEKLNDKGLSISILRKGKKALSMGRRATPTISSFLTRSDNIQIDSITQVAKLDRDIKKANQESE